MNDLYNETITRNGQVYHYDPDMDVYYRRYTHTGHWDSYGWIYVVLFLSAIAYYIEYLQ